MLSRASQVCHSIWKIPEAAKASPIGFSFFGLTYIPMTSSRTPEVSLIKPYNIIKPQSIKSWCWNRELGQNAYLAYNLSSILSNKNNKRLNDCRKVVQSGSHLATIYKDLISSPRTQKENMHGSTCYNSTSGRAETGRSLDGWSSLASKPSLLYKVQISENLTQIETKGEGVRGMTIEAVLWSSHLCTQVQTNMCNTHKNSW